MFKDGRRQAINGQSALAFVKQVPLWIVAANRSQLERATVYRDLWSNSPAKVIPRYIRVNKRSARTSIIIPIKEDEEVYGVINFESKEYLEINEDAKRELQLIAESLSILYLLSTSNRLQAMSTDHAMKVLNELRVRFPAKFAKPTLFLASSSAADEVVEATILETVKEFSDRLSVVHWRELVATGDINAHILREITDCQIGVCYLSEPAPESTARSGRSQTRAPDGSGGYKYRDNMNVLFEAGMLNALVAQRVTLGRPSAWIPIREKDSPDAPFDLRAQRTIVVPRSRQSVQRESLRTALRNAIEHALRDSNGRR
ncbi:MAG TPA: GAF domain-containing protein [Polyangiaceae bacterium]|nr:GAF domain-containing protein [Polyangiaceae bacterium]